MSSDVKLAPRLLREGGIVPLDAIQQFLILNEPLLFESKEMVREKATAATITYRVLVGDLKHNSLRLVLLLGLLDVLLDDIDQSLVFAALHGLLAVLHLNLDLLRLRKDEGLLHTCQNRNENNERHRITNLAFCLMNVLLNQLLRIEL